MVEKLTRTDEEWRAILTPEQYAVLRGGGTEPAFTGAYHDRKAGGVYHCAACDALLFDADDKFDSGTGWPSFRRPVAEGRVRLLVDRSHGMVRTEVRCARCESHLGHVFDDGDVTDRSDASTGQRYCINSVSLALREPSTGSGED